MGKPVPANAAAPMGDSSCSHSLDAPLGALRAWAETHMAAIERNNLTYVQA
ncbi:hypothetical protein [Streptomyces sp. NPDC050534]|uniref:hypothetical protein n=1 Tax=Streptomyces sp. NPDC050534 TaxID=3365625 RepID=UPI0037A16B24